jgi:hypothetical protein
MEDRICQGVRIRTPICPRGWPHPGFCVFFFFFFSNFSFSFFFFKEFLEYFIFIFSQVFSSLGDINNFFYSFGENC